MFQINIQRNITLKIAFEHVDRCHKLWSSEAVSFPY